MRLVEIHSNRAVAPGSMARFFHQATYRVQSLQYAGDSLNANDARASAERDSAPAWNSNTPMNAGR